MGTEGPKADLSRQWEAVVGEVKGCTKCILHRSRLLAVPGEGPPDARILFIGEAPGFHENRQGRPFVGAAGQFLEELLGSIGLAREEVYITNVVKCRPPGNRDPESEEIAACAPYLDRQIALLRPRLIVTLGRFSMARYFPRERISRVHGVARQVGGVLCYAMYHPAAALHQPQLRKELEEDMRKIPELLAQVVEVEEPKPAEGSRQLNLF